MRSTHLLRRPSRDRGTAEQGNAEEVALDKRMEAKSKELVVKAAQACGEDYMDHDRRQHALDLKILPVVLAVFTGALMWMASAAAPAAAFVIPGRSLGAAIMMIAGAIVSGLGVASFQWAKTTVNPMKLGSASVLVDGGIYRRTRNPMYLGFLLVLLGWAIALANIVAFVLLPAFIFYMNLFQIEPEEKALVALFGQPFVDYKTRVPRWF